MRTQTKMRSYEKRKMKNENSRRVYWDQNHLPQKCVVLPLPPPPPSPSNVPSFRPDSHLLCYRRFAKLFIYIFFVLFWSASRDEREFDWQNSIDRASFFRFHLRMRTRRFLFCAWTDGTWASCSRCAFSTRNNIAIKMYDEGQLVRWNEVFRCSHRGTRYVVRRLCVGHCRYILSHTHFRLFSFSRFAALSLFNCKKFHLLLRRLRIFLSFPMLCYHHRTSRIFDRMLPIFDARVSFDGDIEWFRSIRSCKYVSISLDRFVLPPPMHSVNVSMVSHTVIRSLLLSAARIVRTRFPLSAPA